MLPRFQRDATNWCGARDNSFVLICAEWQNAAAPASSADESSSEDAAFVVFGFLATGLQ